MPRKSGGWSFPRTGAPTMDMVRVFHLANCNDGRRSTCNRRTEACSLKVALMQTSRDRSHKSRMHQMLPNYLKKYLHTICFVLCCPCCSHASDLGEPLICQISGHATCSSDGWCLKFAEAGDPVNLKVDTEARRISLGTIKGTLSKTESNDCPDCYKVLWGFNLVRYNDLKISYTNSTYTASLSEEGAAGANVINFSCSKQQGDTPSGHE